MSGIVCEKCGGRMMAVRTVKKSGSILRERVCRKCRARVLTLEQVARKTVANGG